MARDSLRIEISQIKQSGSIKFNKKVVKKGFRLAGKEVQKQSKKLVNTKKTSLRDQFPGRKTGTLFRAVRFKVGRKGLSVKIFVKKTAKMKEFYPAFLNYGVKIKQVVVGVLHRVKIL